MDGALTARSTIAWLLLVPGWLLLGCAGPEADPPSEPAPPSVTVRVGEAPVREAGPAEVSLRTADESALAELVADARGKVVLVDFWATWCLPCVEQFPHTVELHERFAAEGLVVISVSFDEPESGPTVLSFLQAEKAAFDNLLSPYGIGPKAWEAFGIEDGALPHIRLYDREGDVHKSFGASDGGHTVDDVDRAVEELLKQP